MASTLTALPQTGRLEVDIKVTADINMSAYAARQKVNIAEIQARATGR